MKYPDKNYVSIQNHSNGLFHKTSWEGMRGMLNMLIIVNGSEPCSSRQEDQVNKL